MARAGQRLSLLLHQVRHPAPPLPVLAPCHICPRIREQFTHRSSHRDTGVAAIESLISKRGSFDYILLETSGLADPGNLAPLFWVDDGLGSSIYLDGIVTVVDAKNILLSLDEPAAAEMVEEGHEHSGPHLTTAHLQISHADVVILNKCDAVDEEQLGRVKERVMAINGMARMHMTQYGRIKQLEGVLLDLHAYDGVNELDTVGKGHSHLDPVSRLLLRWSTRLLTVCRPYQH